MLAQKLDLSHSQLRAAVLKRSTRRLVKQHCRPGCRLSTKVTPRQRANFF